MFTVRPDRNPSARPPIDLAHKNAYRLSEMWECISQNVYSAWVYACLRLCPNTFLRYRG